MKKMEEQNKFKDSRMQSAKPGDKNAMKARKGKVGGFVDYFDQSDLDYIEQSVKEVGSPDCHWFFLA